MDQSSSCYDQYGFAKKKIIENRYLETGGRSTQNQRIINDEWESILSNWSYWVKNREKLKPKIYRGIPHSLRGTAWLFMSDIARLKNHYPPNYFEICLSSSTDTKSKQQILLDLDRTFTNHRLFKEGEGKRHLFEILAAYSSHNPVVGYAQGMSYVAGTILMQIPNVIDAFWVLVWMVDNHLLPYYNRKMSGLIEDAALFEELLKKFSPNLASHLAQHNTETLLYITPWFMTLFTHLSNWETVLRIWDLFFYEGVQCIFRLCLTILQVCEKDLMNLSSLDQLLPYLLSIHPQKLQPDLILETASSKKLENILKHRGQLNRVNLDTTQKQRKVVEDYKPSFLDRVISSFTPDKKTPTFQRKRFSVSLAFLKPENDNTPTKRKRPESMFTEQATENLDPDIEKVFSIDKENNNPNLFSSKPLKIEKNELPAFKQFSSPKKLKEHQTIISPVKRIKKKIEMETFRIKGDDFLL